MARAGPIYILSIQYFTILVANLISDVICSLIWIKQKLSNEKRHSKKKPRHSSLFRKAFELGYAMLNGFTNKSCNSNSSCETQ